MPHSIACHLYKRVKRYLQFRDWLRTHHKDRNAYAVLKKELAEKYSDDLLNYCFAKETFIASIDKKTGFKGLHIVKALTPKEWEVVAYLREQCAQRSLANTCNIMLCICRKIPLVAIDL